MAVRRQLSYDSGGRPNQLTYLYTPVAAGDAPLPTLLAVYPGAADTWEGVSIPLAAAGYAVVAVGPAYALDLEDDIAELQRLVAFARAGALPGADGERMALLGGSYSSLHVQALLERDSGFRGVVLLGGISDIFDMRRRFEHGSFIPPFGLDQALIALGTPDISPERPWRSHYLLADQPSAELTSLYDLTLAFLRRTLLVRFQRDHDYTVFGSFAPVRYRARSAMMLLERAGNSPHYVQERLYGNAHRLDSCFILCLCTDRPDDRGHRLDRPEG